MENKEWSASSLFEVLGDDLARQILVVSSEQPRSADELVDSLDVSLPTVYRRVNTLLEYDFVVSHQQVDSDGNHYKTFETTLERITFEIEDGEPTIDIQMRQNLADQFDALWADLEQSSPEGDLAGRDAPERNSGTDDVHHG